MQLSAAQYDDFIVYRQMLPFRRCARSQTVFEVLLRDEFGDYRFFFGNTTVECKGATTTNYLAFYFF